MTKDEFLSNHEPNHISSLIKIINQYLYTELYTDIVDNLEEK